MEESKGRLSLVIMRTMLQKVREAQRRELIIRLEYSRPTSSRGISLINGHGTNFWRCGPRTGDRTFRVTFLQVWFITARNFYVRMRIISFLIMVYPFGGVEVWDIIVHLARVREKERERKGQQRAGVPIMRVEGNLLRVTSKLVHLDGFPIAELLLRTRIEV